MHLRNMLIDLNALKNSHCQNICLFFTKIFFALTCFLQKIFFTNKNILQQFKNSKLFQWTNNDINMMYLILRYQFISAL